MLNVKRKYIIPCSFVHLLKKKKRIVRNLYCNLPNVMTYAIDIFSAIPRFNEPCPSFITVLYRFYLVRFTKVFYVSCFFFATFRE